MSMKLYVGNLPHSVQESDLVDWVSSEGFNVQAARVIRDRATGQSRGFGFVELAPGEDMAQAIARLNGMIWEGRTLHVNEAHPEPSRGGGGGAGGRAGGGGGGGGSFAGRDFAGRGSRGGGRGRW